MVPSWGLCWDPTSWRAACEWIAPAGRHCMFVWDHMTQDQLKALGCCQPWSLPVCGHGLAWRGSNHGLPWGHSARDGRGWQRVFPVPPPHPDGGL